MRRIAGVMWCAGGAFAGAAREVPLLWQHRGAPVGRVPEPVRQGAVRLVAHLHGERDGSTAAPPAAVTALWRPYRRLRVAVQKKIS